ncbi:MAG: ABC transporter permease [Anaerolineae bacterium]|nr:ABC transporter permease [Anaerolineae bacterium]
MRFLDLALKDLSQMLREKRSLLFLVFMPVAFTIFMGFAYQGVDPNADNRLKLGWVNLNPTGLAAKTLFNLLEKSDVVRVEEIDPQTDAGTLAEWARSGKYSGILVVPPNFNRNAMNGKETGLTLLCNEYSTEGQSTLQAVRGALTRLMSSVKIADLVVTSLNSQDDAEYVNAFEEAAAAWQNEKRGNLSFVLEKAEGGMTFNQALAENPYKQSSPGILVQFAVFGLVTSASILVEERKSGTLQRLMTTSMTSAEIIAGHMLAMFTLTLVQSVLLVIFGQVLLKVNYLSQPPAVVLILITLSLWVASLGLFIGVVAKDESQVVLFSLIAMFVFSGLGGTWFPMESAGSAFSIAGHLTPTFYAMQGLQNILIRGQGFISVLLPALILVVFALLFFGLALWRFRLSLQR